MMLRCMAADGTLRPALNRVFTNNFEVKAGKLIIFTDPPYVPGSKTEGGAPE